MLLVLVRSHLSEGQTSNSSASCELEWLWPDLSRKLLLVRVLGIQRYAPRVLDNTYRRSDVELSKSKVMAQSRSAQTV